MSIAQRGKMTNLTLSFTFRDDEDMIDLMLIHPILLWIFADINMWAYERALPVVITRVVDERIEGVSKTDIHKDGRAIDISLRGWQEPDIKEVVYIFNAKYSEMYGAFSLSDNQPRLIPDVDHGTAPHLHIQIRRFQ